MFIKSATIHLRNRKEPIKVSFPQPQTGARYVKCLQSGDWLSFTWGDGTGIVLWASPRELVDHVECETEDTP